ncbi:MAG: TPM domain-containing protein [Bacteroidota bacterium]|nr:TPM domain-containing protein [Bacteroidota bacterium]
MATSNFLSDQEQANVLAAISDAESQTSGEIRLHLESRCKGDVLDRAAVVFETLAMHKTALRTGVLFYLATEDRKFAILGDGGINAVVPDNFWNDVKNRVIDGLASGKPAEGIASGIRLAGEQLSAHFPLEANDINELSNDISFGS